MNKKENNKDGILTIFLGKEWFPNENPPRYIMGCDPYKTDEGDWAYTIIEIKEDKDENI